MPNPSVWKNINNAYFKVMLFAALSLFCMEVYADDNIAGNRGFMESKKTSEIKKEQPVKTRSSKSKSRKIEENQSDLTTLQQDARMYRQEGVVAQQRGDTDAALVYYQKAIQLDPSYAVAYNDLGIIYEAAGDDGRAEDSYLRAVKINPNFLSAYSNLALFYENKRDLKNAAYYWHRRAELGSPDDPWTAKARTRYRDIGMVMGEIPIDSREQDVMELVKDVSMEKNILRKDNKALAKYYFKKAKLDYQKGDADAALKKAVDAGQLDPTNEEITKFIDKLRVRLLSK